MEGFCSYIRLRRLAAGLMLALGGCHQVMAPIHVWAPPRLQSVVGHKVAVAPIAGDQKIAGPLLTAMITHAPRDSGRALHCIDARTLQDKQTIRLVSAVEGETSDIANFSLARRQNVDFLLTGEIVRQSSKPKLMKEKKTPNNEHLAVSWKLVDVSGQSPATGFPIVTSYDSALDPQTIADAAAKDAWTLITPHVETSSVQLAAPRLTLASERIRRGNAAAKEGDWMSAEESWNRVLTIFPKDHAALHNLSIAAVARQDYEGASRLIGAALKLSNKSLYRETAVWIEARQRDYHQAFDLPDPINGWSATHREN